MRSLRIALSATTPVMIGRWLCLDSVLDAALEIQGVAEEDRVLPIAGWDGARMHAPGRTVFDAVRAGEMVYAASAVYAERQEGMQCHFLQSHNKLKVADELPFRGGRGKPANRVDTKRGPAQAIKNSRQAVLPGIFVWKATGEADGIRALLESLEGIGAKTSMGYGRFRRPVDISATDERMCGVADEAGLIRPVPAWMAGSRAMGDLSAALRTLETVRPPYWRRDFSVEALVPATPRISGLIG